LSDKEPIARLPKNDWEPVVQAIGNLIDLLRTGEVDEFLVKFEYGTKSTPPYVAAKLTKGNVVLMFPGNEYLHPDLSSLQKSQLDGLGWSTPLGAKANYTKLMEGSLSAMTSAMYLVATIRMVFEVPVTTNIHIKESKLFNEAMTQAGLVLIDNSVNSFRIP
jgi:hypothetical protein